MYTDGRVKDLYKNIIVGGYRTMDIIFGYNFLYF